MLNFSKSEIVSCIVIDVIFEKNISTVQSIADTLEVLSNRRYLEKCPRNSIIVKVPNFNEYTIVYPFFSQHFSLPIKPGEHVWCFFPDGFGSNDIGYWMSRKATDEFIDDVNFTHNSRSSRRNYFKNLISKNKDSNIVDYHSVADKIVDYNAIVGKSLSNSLHTFENIPRVKKRPSDFLIQGSNNSQMVFTSGKDPKSGTVILTTGRGSTEKTSSEEIENAGGQKENNKASVLTKEGSENLNEGNLDILNDKVSLIISENPLFLNDSNENEYEFDDLSHFFVRADRIRNEARDSIDMVSPVISAVGSNIKIEGSDLVSVVTSGWETDMDKMFTLIENLASELNNLATGTAQFATGVGPTGPATNATQITTTLQEIKSMKKV